MRIQLLILAGILTLAVACKSESRKRIDKTSKSLQKESDSAPVNSIETNKETSFNHFLAQFKAETFPYYMKFGTINGRIMEFPNEYDFETDMEVVVTHNEFSDADINKWILNQGIENKLTAWIKEVPEWDGRWYSINPGVCLEEDGIYYCLLNTYEAISYTNGGYWNEWLLVYDDEGNLLEMGELGNEGVYTSAHTEFLEDDELWQRRTSYKSLSIEFDSGNDIRICQLTWNDIMGDISNSDRQKMDLVKDSTDYIAGNIEKDCWYFEHH